MVDALCDPYPNPNLNPNLHPNPNLNLTFTLTLTLTLEVADALCDIQYVLSGTVLEFGLGSSFLGVFTQLHQTRMEG